MKVLHPVVVAGTPHEIGRQLGELARPEIDTYRARSAAWQAVAARLGDPLLPVLRRAAEAAFPAAVAEIDGIVASPGLSIFRADPADPDDENTLATAAFDICASGVDVTVRRGGATGFALRVARDAG